VTYTRNDVVDASNNVADHGIDVFNVYALATFNNDVTANNNDTSGIHLNFHAIAHFHGKT